MAGAPRPPNLIGRGRVARFTLFRTDGRLAGLARRSRPGGLFLNHGIASQPNRRSRLGTAARRVLNPALIGGTQFRERYVFPSGGLVPISEAGRAGAFSKLNLVIPSRRPAKPTASRQASVVEGPRRVGSDRSGLRRASRSLDGARDDGCWRECARPGEAGLAAQVAGFEVRDVEHLREHYARTLALWAERLEAHHGEAVRVGGERMVRLWRLYMGIASWQFARGEFDLGQTLLQRPAGGPSDLPPTRADLYA